MNSGNQTWNCSVGSAVETFIAEDQGTILASTLGGDVVAIEPFYGNVIWKEHVDSRAYSPLAYDNNIYAGTYDGQIVALNYNSGTPVWSFNASGSASAKPVVYNGTIYVGSWDGYLYALNPSNGAVVWKFKTSGPIKAAPLIDKGILYIGSGDTEPLCPGRKDRGSCTGNSLRIPQYSRRP